MSKSPHIILLVEDSDEDYYATKRAFEKSGLANELYRCADGEEAIDYLYQKGTYADTSKAPRPNVILLDLNLPKKDGKEVLGIIKNDPNLSTIPVIILTTSNDQMDITECYAQGANSYIQKPVDLNRFVESIQKLQDYWFEITILPDEK